MPRENQNKIVTLMGERERHRCHGGRIGGVRGLVGFNMIVRPTENKDWDTVVDEQHSSAWHEKSPAALSRKVDAATYLLPIFFDTREGPR